MTLLNTTQAEEVSQAIAQAEQQTDAELIVVLAKQADEYYYIPTLWAALLSLLTPAALQFTPFWLDINETLTTQFLVFIGAALVFRIPGLMRLLIPARVKKQRANLLARAMFLENNLHHTKDESGVLIFVSEFEHYIEIIADRGINVKVESRQWTQLVDEFVQAVKSKQTHQGMLNMVSQCGILLETHVPATAEKNELPNHLIQI